MDEDYRGLRVKGEEGIPPVPDGMLRYIWPRLPKMFIPLFFIWIFGPGAVAMGLAIPLIMYVHWRSEVEERWRGICVNGGILYYVDNEYLLKRNWFCSGPGYRPVKITEEEKQRILRIKKKAVMKRKREEERKEQEKQERERANREHSAAINAIYEKIKNGEEITREEELILNPTIYKRDPPNTPQDDLHYRYDVPRHVWYSKQEIEEMENERRKRKMVEEMHLEKPISALYAIIAREYGCDIANICTNEKYLQPNATYRNLPDEDKDKIYEYWKLFSKLQKQYRKWVGMGCPYFEIQKQLEEEEKAGK